MSLDEGLARTVAHYLPARDVNLISVATAIVAGIFLLILTGVVRRYAMRRHMLDIPNARSSHTIPTPRGGGVGIVISFATA